MNPEDRTYSGANPPKWIPEAEERHIICRELLYLHELADRDFPAPSPLASRLSPSPFASFHLPNPCHSPLLFTGTLDHLTTRPRSASSTPPDASSRRHRSWFIVHRSGPCRSRCLPVAGGLGWPRRDRQPGCELEDPARTASRPTPARATRGRHVRRCHRQSEPSPTRRPACPRPRQRSAGRRPAACLPRPVPPARKRTSPARRRSRETAARAPSSGMRQYYAGTCSERLLASDCRRHSGVSGCIRALSQRVNSFQTLFLEKAAGDGRQHGGIEG